MLPRRYACYLLFQLKTHHDALAGGEHDIAGSQVGAADAADGGEAGAASGGQAGAAHEEVPALSLSGATFLLVAITVMVALHSE